MFESLQIDKSRFKYDLYQFKEVIGRGSFGEVEKCEHKQSKRVCAIKTIFINSPLNIEYIKEEVENMNKVSSSYILEVQDHFFDDNLSSYVVVTPYYKMGSLQQYMDKIWSFEEVMIFFYQMSNAFAFLEAEKICHLDLKPDNILLKADGEYILCDFGCSRKVESENNNMKSFNAMKVSTNTRGGGTTEYGSPELVLTCMLSTSTDIWSLGIILYKLVYKKHPLLIQGQTQYSKKLQKFNRGEIKINYPPCEKFESIIQLMKKMLTTVEERKNSKISWIEVLTDVHKILGIDQKRKDHVITDFSCLLKFVDHSSIIISGVIYFMNQCKKYFEHQSINCKSIISVSISYLLKLIEEILSYTKNIQVNQCQFYFFKSLLQKVTKKQKQYAKYIQNQIKQMARQYSVTISSQSIHLLKQTLLVEYEKLYKKLTKSQNKQIQITTEIQQQKLIKLLNFIAFTNKLQYPLRRKLQSFCTDLINQ